ncbi:LOB domain-containing protein 18-like [Impatiens glandulifera]|uniref:LOB domain-containing protein 18-like n=1 Tax=Impatiens glandulifera TaxID=253017 RepID=UPI001FB132A1|nr:LOB domain-containing protein 18-like [Impatiens glandulifera]
MSLINRGSRSSGGGGGPCGACKFLRRKCLSGCIFAPYYLDSDHFAAVHKVFGASNVSKLLHHIPIHNRSYAALTLTYQAQARLTDPVYGCVAHIFALQQQVVNLQSEVTYLQSRLATATLPQTQHERAYNSLAMKHGSSQYLHNELAEALQQHMSP